MVCFGGSGMEKMYLHANISLLVICKQCPLVYHMLSSLCVQASLKGGEGYSW